jgi:hypothetical protein
MRAHEIVFLAVLRSIARSAPRIPGILPISSPAKFAERRQKEKGDRAYREDAQPANRVFGPNTREQHTHAGCSHPENHPDDSDIPGV